MSQPTIYLDNAATTPVLPEVREAMLPFLGDAAFGNPSSPHRLGRAARAAVEEARHQVAAAVGADPRWVLFTSGGTPAHNLAVLGGAPAARAAGRPFRVAVSPTEPQPLPAPAHALEYPGGEPMSLAISWLCWNSAQSTLITARVSPNRISAVASTTRVLPDPVGAAISVWRRALMAGQPWRCGSVGAPKRVRNHCATAGWNVASASGAGPCADSMAVPGSKGARAAAALGGSVAGLLALVALILLWMSTARRRANLVRLAIPECRPWFGRHGWKLTLLAPFGHWVWLCGLVASAWSNKIEWRGIRFRLSRPGARAASA